uniref:Uncharacterized protein n=1 Tax=Timema bartmani TaxID=61472 RepID=A0A7R9HYI4_9NEOP|nr:unnamed protein product [Timema bartmani]
MCVVCGEVLSNESLKQNKLKRDLEIKHKIKSHEFDRYIPEVMAKYNWVRSPFDIDIEDSPEHFSDIAGLQEKLIEVQSDEGLISATFPRRTADLKSGEQTKVLLMNQAADLCRGLAENWSPLAVGHLDLRRWQRRFSPISSFNFVTSAADSDDFFLNVFDFERRVKLFLFSAVELVAIMRSLTNWRKEFKPPFRQLMCLERKDVEESFALSKDNTTGYAENICLRVLAHY